MYTKLHLFKEDSEVTLELHELVFLAERLVEKKMETQTFAPEDSLTKKLEALDQYNKYLKNKKVDDEEVMRLYQRFLQAKSAHSEESKGEEAIDDKESPIPNYHIAQEKLKQHIQTIRSAVIKSYAEHYQIREFELHSYFNYLSNPDSMLMHDPVIMKLVEKVSQALKQKQPPQTAFSNQEALLPIIFPEHIKTLHTLDDWMLLAKYFKEQNTKIPVTGWWFLVAGRVLSIRNKGNKQKFLYTNDHGSKEAIIENVRSCLENFTFDEEYINLIQHLDKFWNKLNSDHLPLIEKMFISSFNEIQGTISYKQLEALLFETFKELLILLQSPEHLNLCQQILIKNELNLPVETLMQAKHVFINTMQRFSYMAFITSAYSKTQFNISGKYPLYTVLAGCMHRQDSGLLIVMDMIEKHQINLNKGVMESLLRPCDAYFDKYEGASYTQFARSLMELQKSNPDLSDREITKRIRKILAGKEHADCPNFLPNLVAVMFSVETARIPRLFLSSMMLLDLIENEFSEDNKAPFYSWLNALVSPERIVNGTILSHGDAEKRMLQVNNLYELKVDLKQFDGLYPQAHYESATDTTYKKGQLSASRQKEGMIIIQWLYMVLKDSLKRKGIIMYCSDKPLVIGVPNQASIRDRYTRYLKSQNAENTDMKKFTKDTVLKIIIPVMKERLSQLKNILSKDKHHQRFFPIASDAQPAAAASASAPDACMGL